MKNKDWIRQTADHIIDALQNGTAPWIKPWKAEELQNTLPYNPVTGKNYNGINSINLMLEGHSDPRWLTYKQAQSINAQVKRGEKSTLIQYWQFSELVDRLDQNGNPMINDRGEVEKIEVKLENPKVFFANVFNAEQIANMPKLEIKPIRQKFEIIQEAEKILADSGATIRHYGNTAYYSPKLDEIVLPKKEQFMSEGAYYATALHELGHWSGHETRLNRELNNPFGSKEYAKEELRAEIASFLFNGKIGLDYDPKQHLSYIDSWVSILQDHPSEILKATSDATKIVDFLQSLSLEQKQQIDTRLDIKSTKELDMAKQKTYLYVPFLEKDIAKDAGAKWDREAKMWYAPKGADLTKLSPWLNAKENTISNDMSVTTEFKKALEAAGLLIEGEPVMDGKLHRVSVQNDRGQQKSGAYVGFLNGHPAGHIQNFKTGYKENWKSAFSVNNAKKQEIDIKNALETSRILRQERETELSSAYEKTAIKLQNEYNGAKWANPRHKYLQNKGFDKNFYLKQDEHGNLLVPLRDIEGKYWATQRIFANGDKMIGAMRTKEEKEQGIEYPAKKHGNFFLLGAKSLNNVQEVFLCEGFATAASVYEAMKKPTIMGVDAGNLEIIVTSIKEKYPKMQIMIAADNDIKREFENKPNVGKNTALAIQNKHKDVLVALPNFSNEEARRGLSDFNDLMKSRGLEEVKKQIKEQISKELHLKKTMRNDKELKQEIKANKDISISL